MSPRDLDDLTHRDADWAGLRVLVTGLGISGFAAADALIQHGAVVTVVDRGNDSEKQATQAGILGILGADVRLGAEHVEAWPGPAPGETGSTGGTNGSSGPAAGAKGPTGSAVGAGGPIGAAQGTDGPIGAAQGADGPIGAGGDPMSRLQVDLVVTSPGWRPDSPILREALEHGIPVWSEVELAWRLRPNIGAAPWLAVTGTNGKTTTVQLVETILRAAGLRAVAAGNVGTPILDAVQHPEPYDVIAVELSSFQLHHTHTMAPLASVVLNLCLLYTSPSPRDKRQSRMPSSA